MNQLSPAPTGRHVIAQGNALGMAPEMGQALKGRNNASNVNACVSAPHGSAPSGREFLLSFEPRALPWAVTLRPVGAEFVANLHRIPHPRHPARRAAAEAAERGVERGRRRIQTGGLAMNQLSPAQRGVM